MTQKVSKNKKTKYVLGIVLCSLLFVLSFCGRYFQSAFRYVAGFFLGAFGMAFYGVLIAVITACSLALAGKKVKISTKYVVNFILLFVSIVLFVHLLTSIPYTYVNQKASGEFVNYATHVGYLFNYYDFVSFGGVVFGSLIYGLQRVITFWGVLILSLGFLVWEVFATGNFFYGYFTGKITLLQESDRTTAPTQPVVAPVDTPIDDEELKRKRAWEYILGQDGAQYPEGITTPPVEVPTENIFGVAPQPSTLGGGAQISQPTAEEILFPTEPTSNGSSFFATPEEPVAPIEEPAPTLRSAPIVEQPPVVDTPSNDWIIASPAQPEVVQTEPVVDTTPIVVEQPRQVFEPTPVEQPIPQPIDENPFIDDTDDNVDIVDVVVPEPIVEQPVIVEQPPVVTEVDEPAEIVDDDEIVAIPGETPLDDGIVQERLDLITRGQLRDTQKKVHQYSEYVLPPSDLLNDATIVVDNGQEDRLQAAERIVAKLAVFHIKVELVKIIVGPSVTQYQFAVLSERTRMGDFAQYADDLKACLEAPDDILIHAPIQGTGLVGIEVANKVKTPVVLRSLLEADAFKNAKGKLVFAIGKDLIGNVITGDLAEMPHLLVAGTTGSGKSVALNCLIVSLMYKYGPEYIRFLMVDPKYVELSRYNGIPHMLTRETIINIGDALAGMDYLVKEMESRYQLFKDNGVDSIVSYNKQINPKIAQRLPYLVYIVDELADLMSVNKKAFEEKLARLTAKARASGIHIVLATQRPSVDVITGTIKNNLSCRMALKVPAPQDSKTIINGAGADKLLGYGDMLFIGPGSATPTRIQGAYVSNDEIKAIVEYLRASNELYFDDSVSNEIFVSKQQPVEVEEDDVDAGDDKKQKGDHALRVLGKKALKYWLTERGGKASMSSLQRGMSIGFNKAGKVYDMLQKLKYIDKLSDSESSSKPVNVLVTLEQLDELFPDVIDEE